LVVWPLAALMAAGAMTGDASARLAMWVTALGGPIRDRDRPGRVLWLFVR
jgi:hypothetical protein